MDREINQFKSSKIVQTRSLSDTDYLNGTKLHWAFICYFLCISSKFTKKRPKENLLNRISTKNIDSNNLSYLTLKLLSLI